MSLLNSSLVFALAPLLLLPLLIHFLNKRFPQRFNFSSVSNLRKTAAERSRIYRWRHRILTIVRTLFLLLLLFVFLKPVIDTFGNAAGNRARQVLIIVDHSMSMEYREGGMTSRARAVIEADKILGTLRPSDSVNVISAGAMRTLSLAGISGGRGMIAQGRAFSALKQDTSMEGVAGCALWLLSDLGVSTTGEVVHVDAGFHMMGMPDPAEEG